MRNPVLPKKVSRRLGTLLLGLSLLLGLASPAEAQRRGLFPIQVGVGVVPTGRDIILYYNLGATITPLVLTEASGGPGGPLTYSLNGERRSSAGRLESPPGFEPALLGFAFDPATRTLSGTPTLAGGGLPATDLHGHGPRGHRHR